MLKCASSFDAVVSYCSIAKHVRSTASTHASSAWLAWRGTLHNHWRYKHDKHQEERNKKQAQSGIKRPYQAAVQQPQPYFQQQAGQYAAPFLSNIQAAKMASTCLKCGLTGHWHKDFVCPRNQNQTSAVYHNPAAAQQSSATGVTPVSAVPTQMQAAQTQFPAIMYTKQ